MNLNAEVIAIGTEILLGELTDTNSVFLARTLRDLGINLYYMTSVGDNEARIADAIRSALGRAQIVITCGGLGPTIDDKTRESVAAATDRDLTFHQDLLDAIAARFSGFRAQMTENNRRQAYVPDGAVIIENPVGTAPSFAVEVGDQVVISLPGVPRELKYLMIERVVPYLREHYGIVGAIIKARILKAAGIGESALDEMIGADILERSNPTVGLAAHSGQIDVRITAKADTEAEADRLIAITEALLRERIGDYIFGVDTDTLEQAYLTEAQAHEITTAIAEIGIDPIISQRFSSGAIVQVETLRDPEVLRAEWGITEAGSLRDLAEAAVRALHDRSGAGVCLVALSYPDLALDNADVNEASAVAVWVNGAIRSRSYGFGGATDTARVWMVTWALSNAWRMLREARA